MAHFEKISKFADADIPMPTRATQESAGYDLYVAEDITIPPYDYFMGKIADEVLGKEEGPDFFKIARPLSLDDMSQLTEKAKARIPLVSTGVKCKLDDNQYLEISLRSSTPYKHWLILGNAIGVIDQDYYYTDNPICLQIINLSPFAIRLKKGDRIGQGIIKTYGLTEDDLHENEVRSGGFGSTTLAGWDESK